MKKSVVILSAILIFCLVLSSCSSNKTSQSQIPVIDESNQETSNTSDGGAVLHNTINLENIENARHLGGYKTTDGRIVKDNLILRTGSLEKASEEDIRKLTETYKLAAIVDLRTNTESSKKPSPEMPGVKNYLFSTYPENYQDMMDDYIAAAENNESNEEFEDSLLEDPAFAWYVKLGGTPEKFVSNMSYLSILLANGEEAHKAYGGLLKTLLNNEEGGSILFHCSAGKDRTGMGAALILSLLGVAREDILNDYLLTNEYNKDLIQYGYNAAVEGDFPQHYIDNVESVYGVHAESLKTYFDEIDKSYDSIEAYAIANLGITEDDIEKLIEMYTDEA